MAPENCWSTASFNSVSFDGTGRDELKGKGNPDGIYWIPAETDMGNRTQNAFGGGWMWKAGEQDKIYSVDKLMDCYYTSVGRNSNLLLGMAINDEGLFEDYKQFEDFGAKIKKTFEKPLAAVSGEGYIHTITFENPTDISHLIICEDIKNGQRIRSFKAEAETADKKTITLYDGECIGHKRIIKSYNKAVKKVTLKILKSEDIPLIRNFIIY
jgi:alpha-L-fucosidase